MRAAAALLPRQAASVDAWASWYDTAGPMSALINVDGTCTAMSLQRGVVTHGAYKATLTNVASGCHRYFFLFKDSGGNIVTYPTTGSLGIGPAGSCADWDTSRPATGAGCDGADVRVGSGCPVIRMITRIPNARPAMSHVWNRRGSTPRGTGRWSLTDAGGLTDSSATFTAPAART